MGLQLANTSLENLDRLRGDEQKAVKLTAFDLQRNPRNRGISHERIASAKDPNFSGGACKQGHPDRRSRDRLDVNPLLCRSSRRCI